MPGGTLDSLDCIVTSSCREPPVDAGGSGIVLEFVRPIAPQTRLSPDPSPKGKGRLWSWLFRPRGRLAEGLRSVGACTGKRSVATVLAPQSGAETGTFSARHLYTKS